MTRATSIRFSLSRWFPTPNVTVSHFHPVVRRFHSDSVRSICVNVSSPPLSPNLLTRSVIATNNCISDNSTRRKREKDKPSLDVNMTHQSTCVTGYPATNGPNSLAEHYILAINSISRNAKWARTEALKQRNSNHNKVKSNGFNLHDITERKPHNVQIEILRKIPRFRKNCRWNAQLWECPRRKKRHSVGEMAWP